MMLTNCTSSKEPGTTAESQVSDDPMLTEWAGPYGGVPPFDKVNIANFKPALENAMAENLAEIDAIANNPESPTFENTIKALELSGEKLDRVQTLYYVWSGNMNNAEFAEVEREMEPKLATFSDQITQNEKLFKRIEAVYNKRESSNLTKEEQRLVWLYHNNFVRAGAKLDATAKKRVSEINERLAVLFTDFSQNVLADETNQYLTINKKEDLAGLPQSAVNAAKSAAEARNMPDAWVINNTRSAVEPFLKFADNRKLREEAFQMFSKRGDMPGANNNNAIITEILQLRAERAKLLGYKTHAHYRLDNTMAATPERAIELMEAVWTPAVARVKEEVSDMQKLAKAEGKNITIEPWDYRYYAEKVRKQRYDLDENEVKPYLQLDKLVEGMFYVSERLFNFNFTPVNNVPVFHPDVKVWEVTDKTTGKHVGLFYFDPYARAGKRSGAWMNAYRSQHRAQGDITTIVSNNSNFVKGNPGEPVLISWSDAETLFHEFGHALHGLASNVTYPSLSGTDVTRDYVEFPSQLLEHWLSTREVLENYAKHYQTGEPIPQSLVERIERASTFNEGFSTTEYLSSALMDMYLHLEGDKKIDPKAYEAKKLQELGMPNEIVMRHRLPQFLHLFSSDSYSAGYYSYLWSDVLTADAYEAFVKGGGPYDLDVAGRLNRYIFSVGNTIDPAEGFRSFRGQDPDIEALMRKRGFPVKK